MNVIDIEMDENKIKQDSEDVDGSVISFHNISYTIETKKACCRGILKKEILNDVSGMMSHGLNAIMGPTGSGKSSLLDVLAARKDPMWLTGKVLMNSKKLPSNYKYLTGYVVQNDILMGTLTVRESLWFSANMRLSSSVSNKEKHTRVEELLEQLGLQKCAETKIGNEMIRGISGGERKRTSIALELITKPSVLFLDEPTTGLDASTANTVMRLLKKLASHGQTVVVSIHQPRYSIFRLFDSLTLLSLGQCLYHGKASSALPYIESLGYACETHNNPADFFLDVINGDIESTSDVNQIEFDEGTKHERDIKITNALLQNYSNSQELTRLKVELQNIENKSLAQTKEKMKSSDMYATSFLAQMKYLLRRDFRNVLRNPQGLIGQVVVNIVFGLIFGLLYYQVDKTPNDGTQNRFGILFFVITNILFSSTSVIELFIKEKSLFLHEYVSGYYRIISYFLSKLMADLVPMRTLSPLFFALITYWMVGLKPTASAFFIFILITTLSGYASVGIALVFAATFETFVVANLFLILVFVFSMVFSGLLVKVDTIMSWLSWLQYLSIARYGLVGVSVNEFMGETYSQCYSASDAPDLGNLAAVNFTTSNIGNQTCVSISGEQFLHEFLDIGTSAHDVTPWMLWQTVVALSCISVGLFFLTYIQMVRTKKYS